MSCANCSSQIPALGPVQTLPVAHNYTQAMQQSTARPMNCKGQLINGQRTPSRSLSGSNSHVQRRAQAMRHSAGRQHHMACLTTRNGYEGCHLLTSHSRTGKALQTSSTRCGHMEAIIRCSCMHACIHRVKMSWLRWQNRMGDAIAVWQTCPCNSSPPKRRQRFTRHACRR